ncbi:MAG: LuxR C-terminal-related transcriptional regulator [Spirochaetaceae bacterium]
MSDSIFLIQKRISKILIIMGSIAIVFNVFTAILNSYSLIQLILMPGILFVAIFVIALLLTHNVDKRAVRIFHVTLFLLNAFISILDQYDSFYGLGLYILGIIIMYRYRYFKKFPKIKILTLMIFLIITVELSSYIISRDFLAFSLSVIIFVIFFILLIFTLYKDEINKVLFLEKNNKKSIDAMIIERNKTLDDMELLKKKVALLESDISNAKSSPKGLDEYSFTVKELEVIELLCRERLTNQELCDRLFISVGTIKQHLSHIFNKCGVKNRVNVIYLFQDNFK